MVLVLPWTLSEARVITCPKCSKDNQDHYKFCLGCGAELPRDAAPKKFAPGTPPQGVPAARGPQIAEETTSLGPGNPGASAAKKPAAAGQVAMMNQVPADAPVIPPL